jgi:hypothetical protein
VRNMFLLRDTNNKRSNGPMIYMLPAMVRPLPALSNLN